MQSASTNMKRNYSKKRHEMSITLSDVQVYVFMKINAQSAFPVYYSRESKAKNATGLDNCQSEQKSCCQEDRYIEQPGEIYLSKKTTSPFVVAHRES